MVLNFSMGFIGTTFRIFGADIGIDGKALQNLILVIPPIQLVLGLIVGFLVDKKGALFFLRIGAIILIFPGIILALFTTKTAMFIFSSIISNIGQTPITICINPYIMDIYGIQETVILGGVLTMFIILSQIATAVIAFLFSIYYGPKAFSNNLLYLCGICLFKFHIIII